MVRNRNLELNPMNEVNVVMEENPSKKTELLNRMEKL